MTTDTWTATSGGRWSKGGHWSLRSKPQSGDDVAIDAIPSQTIDFDVAGLTLDGLALGDDDLDLTGGALTIAGGATLIGATIDGSKHFITRGATALSGDVTVGGTVVWANGGTVTQTAATVTIGGNANEVAVLNNWKTGTWNITDASAINLGGAAGSHIFNAGTFAETNSGSGDTAIVKVDFTSVGVIAVNGGNDLELDGAHSHLSGTYVGAGMIDYGPDGLATLGKLDITAAACGTNWGVVDVKGRVTFNDGSTIMNNSGASWNFDGNVGLALAAGQSAGPVINSDGTIAKIAGTGASVVEIEVNSSGTLSADIGTLALNGASNTLGGEVNGAGKVLFAGGGATTLSANATFSAGSVVVDGGAAFDVSGGFTLTISSMFRETDATVTLGDTISSGHDGFLSIAKSGVYDIADDSGISVAGPPGSRLRNAGTFEKTGTGASAIAVAIVNHGAIEASSGTLDLSDAVTGAGTMTLSGDSRLELDGSVGAGQTVTFAADAGGRLVLDDLSFGGASLFHGVIDNFGAADSIDAGAPFGGATKFVYQENADHKTGFLTLTDGANQAVIHFVGDYKTADFIPHSDGHTGTVFTFG